MLFTIFPQSSRRNTSMGKASFMNKLARFQKKKKRNKAV